MRLLKIHPLLKPVNSYVIDSPQPSNLSYMWNFGSLLATCLIIQIATGVTLAMHYNPSVIEAFNSIEHIMRDVNNGWLIRYLHSNTASAFFFLVYLHIGRGLYYGSYVSPRTLVWVIGTIILIVMILTAFLGYVLPYGQMSLWGATVITNLMSAIPWLGQDIVEFIWGGFSVSNATLNRFFSLHFLMPFVLAALALMHLIVLHDTAGSGNPLGVSGNYDRIPFAPYYLFKDSITIFAFIFVLSIFVFFMPNILGDSENYVMANPMQTPPAIVPEWYLLPFYAILRSIPNKLFGVIAMFAAILIILMLPITDLNRNRGMQFSPLSKLIFGFFVVNFLILMQLGAKHVESPFIEFGQLSTFFYFFYFLVIVPVITLFNNTFIDITLNNRTYNSENIMSYDPNIVSDNINILSENTNILSENINIISNSLNITSIKEFSTLNNNISVREFSTFIINVSKIYNYFYNIHIRIDWFMTGIEVYLRNNFGISTNTAIFFLIIIYNPISFLLSLDSIFYTDITRFIYTVNMESTDSSEQPENYPNENANNDSNESSNNDPNNDPNNEPNNDPNNEPNGGSEPISQIVKDTEDNSSNELGENAESNETNGNNGSRRDDDSNEVEGASNETDNNNPNNSNQEVNAEGIRSNMEQHHEMSNCNHTYVLFVSDSSHTETPIPCDICTHTALDGPDQNALLCTNCHAVVCADCHEPYESNDSGITDEEYEPNESNNSDDSGLSDED